MQFGCFYSPLTFFQLPAIGAWYLLGRVTDSTVEMLASRWQRLVRVAAAGALIIAAVGSTGALRTNLTNYCADDVRIPKLRVLRRAVLAEQVCRDVTLRWPGGSRLALVYAGRQDVGNWGNIQSAIGDGKALRLVLHQPGLAVSLLLMSESSDIPPNEMMIVTELGETFTVSQYEAAVVRGQSWP